MGKKRLLHRILAVTLAVSPALAATAHAQACKNVSGLIGGGMTITLTGDCVIDKPAIIAGNVTIKSDDKGSYTLKRGVGGNLIQIKEGAALTLENVTIDGGKQGNFSGKNGAPLVFVGDGAALIMNDGAVLQNNNAVNGGGVFVENGGAFTMNGGKIRGNGVHAGGGVFVGNGSKFIMAGGEISGNTSDIGGGVFMRHGGEFSMNGGAIDGNAASDLGGGVFVNDASEFIMSGGEISGNTANGVGGGVNVWGGVFTMNGGAICGNTAADGGCVFVYDGSAFNNESGSICNITVPVADQGPAANGGKDEAIAPVNLLVGKFSAGPNPVSKSAGGVTFFYEGKQVRNGKLNVYNASGKIVNSVRVSDKAGGDARRTVGSWNLKDSRGRSISEGNYVVKGNLTTIDGKKEKISLSLGVR